MHIQTYSHTCPPLTRARHYSTLVRIRYAHTPCQIIVTSFLWQDSADRTKRNVLETITMCDNEYQVQNDKVNDGQSAEFTYTIHNNESRIGQRFPKLTKTC